MKMVLKENFQVFEVLDLRRGTSGAANLTVCSPVNLQIKIFTAFPKKASV